MLKLDINLLWTVVNVLVMYAVLRKFLFKPVQDVIAKRQQMVDANLADAETSKKEAAETMNAAQEKLRNVDNEAAARREAYEKQAEVEKQQLLADARKQADAIVADRLTLTGSIGVFGMLLDAGDAMERKLGVTVDAVKSNRSADLGIFRGLTSTERAMMLKSVDRVYETFTNLVAEGRNLPVEKVLDIAGGRVWSGVDALEIGLIDSYGGLKSAIAVAVDKAGLGEEYFIEEVREAPQGLAAILAALNAQVEAHVEHTELFDLYDEYRHVRNALSQQGVLTYCPYVFSFE